MANLEVQNIEQGMFNVLRAEEPIEDIREFFRQELRKLRTIFDTGDDEVKSEIIEVVSKISGAVAIATHRYAYSGTEVSHIFHMLEEIIPEYLEEDRALGREFLAKLDGGDPETVEEMELYREKTDVLEGVADTIATTLKNRHGSFMNVNPERVCEDIKPLILGIIREIFKEPGVWEDDDNELVIYYVFLKLLDLKCISMAHFEQFEIACEQEWAEESY